MRWFCLQLALLAACLSVELARADERPPRDREFVCRFADAPITIDGKTDEAVWKAAETIDHFYMPWQKDAARPKTTTKARLLWDRENLYFFAEMQDSDLYADVKEHDGKTWDNDVFELFFKPTADKPAYYEFQVSAANTVMDMFLPRRGAGGYQRFIADGDFHIDSKVTLRGSLNKWSDTDEGWNVEGRIPWRDFVRTGGRPNVDDKWGFTLCRYDYSVDFEGPELSVNAPLDSLSHPDFHHYEDYASLKFAGPERMGALPKPQADALAELKTNMLKLAPKVVGSPDPPLPYRAERVRPELKPSFPIYGLPEPGSDRLLMIDQRFSYGPARICCTTDKPGELATMLEFPQGGVGYSLAVHTKFAENGYLYVGWNGALEAGKEKHSVISRYTIDRKPPHALLKESEQTIISWPSDGHNGVAIAFGNDGLFYVTSGDGTSDSDTNLKGQGIDHILSKLMRIDVDHPTADLQYSIPKGNPFVGVKDARGETWAYGFRNPWRIAIDPKTDDVWVGQNGQDLFEQVYLVERGANYGWSAYEGSAPFYPEREKGPAKITPPTLEHPHSESRSLTGGVVYYGAKLPELRGAYVYGDYSTGKLWAAKAERGKIVWKKEIADTTLQLTCITVDADGEVLLTDHRGEGQGGLYTLVPNIVNASAAKFPTKLSQTGLFASVAGHQVNPGLLPYDVNAPLWSDGAYKERFLYLPPDAAKPETLASFELNSDDRGWTLPDGSLIVKSFALDSAAGRRWIETRIMAKQEGEWAGYTYAWNDQQTEAMLVAGSGADRDFALPQDDGSLRQQTWHFPSRTECLVCHSRAANFTLGLSTLQFNRLGCVNGEPVDQLSALESLGALRVNHLAEQHAAIQADLKKAGSDEKQIEEQFQRITAARPAPADRRSSLLSSAADGYPKLVNPYDASADLTARAKSYLHSNCAQCHVEAGGGNSAMQLTWSTPLDKMKIADVSPLHHKFDLADAKLVAPGDASRSVLLQRMAIRGRGQMPQLSTNVVDELAVRLIREWITSLKPPAATASNRPRLEAEVARASLITLLTNETDDLLKAALPQLREDEPTLRDGIVWIGRCSCDLERRTFVITFGGEDSVAEFAGTFAAEPTTGKWTATITSITRT